MNGKTDLERQCDRCGSPAVYKLNGKDDDYCGDCACWEVAVRHGETAGALDALGFAVGRLRGVKFDDDQIRRALDATLTRPESDCGYPVSFSELPSEREHTPWMHGLTGLVEASLSGAGA